MCCRNSVATENGGRRGRQLVGGDLRRRFQDPRFAQPHGQDVRFDGGRDRRFDRTAGLGDVDPRRLHSGAPRRAKERLSRIDVLGLRRTIRGVLRRAPIPVRMGSRRSSARESDHAGTGGLRRRSGLGSRRTTHWMWSSSNSRHGALRTTPLRAPQVDGSNVRRVPILRAFVTACVVAILAGGCSSGSDKGAPSTTRPAPPTTARPTVTTRPPVTSSTTATPIPARRSRR